MIIRLAREGEAAAADELVQRAYELYVPRIGRRPAPMDDDYEARVADRRVHLAIEGERIVGLIVLIPESDHLLVENVAVDPARQGEGIGRALLHHAERLARELGLAELRLYTNAAMTENLRLYPRLGYEEVARRSEHGFSRVHFVKRLPPS